MTEAQWLLEYHALAKRDEEEAKRTVEIFKGLERLLVQIFGLDLLKDNLEEEEGTDRPSYLPLSMLLGRREVVEAMIEKIKANQVAQQAITDDEFEAMSAAFASGEIDDIGDMDPIIEEKIEEISEIDRKNYLESLGVKLVDKIPDAPHLKLDVEQVREKIREVTTERLEAEASIEEVTKKPVKMTFDDDA